MVSTKQNKIYIEQEYLALERKAEYQSEFFKGEIFAMAGTSNAHNMITGNFYVILHNRFKGKGCQPYGSDMRIHTPVNSLYAYPDINLVCGEKKFLDNEFGTLLNPIFCLQSAFSFHYRL